MPVAALGAAGCSATSGGVQTTSWWTAASAVGTSLTSGMSVAVTSGATGSSTGFSVTGRSPTGRKLEKSALRVLTSSTGISAETGSTGVAAARDRLGSADAAGATSAGGVQASSAAGSSSGRAGVASGGSTIAPVCGPDANDALGAAAAGSTVRERRRGMPVCVVPSVSASRSTGTAAGASGSTAATDAVGTGAGAAGSAGSAGITPVLVSCCAAAWVLVSSGSVGCGSGTFESGTKRTAGKDTTTSVPCSSPPALKRTLAPSRSERRPTTNRPRRWAPTTSEAACVATLRFASASSSAVMPRPWSRTVMCTKSASRPVVTSTGVCGSENIVAFSRSSASRCAALSALCPSMSGSTTRLRRTRSYSSISEDAVRMTSEAGIGWRTRRPESMPASTSSDSALRRIRVARWSRRKRLDSVPASSSERSRSSRNASWRLRSTWSRRATLTNISAIEPRSAACSRATLIVVWFTSLNAVASWPTSSLDSTVIGARSMPGPWPGTATCSTSLGSWSRTSSAASVRRRSGLTIARAMKPATRIEATTAASVTRMVITARVVAAPARSEAFSAVSVRTASRTGAVWSRSSCESVGHCAAWLGGVAAGRDPMRFSRIWL